MLTTSRFRSYFSFSLYIPAVIACILLTCPQARAASVEDLGSASTIYVSGDGSSVFYGSNYSYYVQKNGSTSGIAAKVIGVSDDTSYLLVKKSDGYSYIYTGSNYSQQIQLLSSNLEGISPDGTAVAGYSSGMGDAGFALVSQDNWDSYTSVMFGSGRAYDISSLNSDGNWVAVGFANYSDATAYIIDSTDYSVQQVTLSGTAAFAVGITADGSMAVGRSGDWGAYQATTWDTSTGTKTYLDLGTALQTQALAVNSSGSVVVGWAKTDETGSVAVFWTKSGSDSTYETLEDALSEKGVSVTHNYLCEATGVSDDGSIIVGTTSGNNVYIARLTNSSSTSGVITTTQLNQSLSTMGQVGPAVSNMGQLSMSRLGSVAGGNGMSFSVNSPGASTGSSPSAGGETGLSSGDEMPGRLDLWFVGSVGTNIEFNGDDLALHGGLGLSWETGEWRFGGGLFGDSRDLDTDYHGNQDIKAIGPGAFVAYSPEDTGLEFRVAAIWQSVDLDLKRGYANGAGYATSKGSTSADVFGINGRAQWTTGVTETIALTPFAEYTWQSTHIDGYSESGGPFPASFDSRDEESNSMRLGLRSDFALLANVDTWAWAAWDHRFESKSSGLGGTTSGLGAFSYPGSRVDQDWADAGVGASWDITERLSTSTSLGFALGCDDDSVSDLTATVGLNYQLW